MVTSLLLLLCLLRPSPIPAEESLNTKSASRIEVIDRGTFFVNMGDVQLTNSYGHLHIPFRLDALIQRVENLRSMQKRIELLTIPDDTRKQDRENLERRLFFMQKYVERMLNSAHARVQEVLESFEDITIGAVGRVKRFVGVIAAVIGGAIAGAATATFTTDTMGKVVENSQEVIANTVDQNLIRLAQDHREITMINETLVLLQQDIEHSYVGAHRLEFEHALLRVTMVASIVERDIRTLTTIVMDAKTGVLDVEALDQKDLRAALKTLNENAVAKGYELSIQEPIAARKLSTTTVFEPSTRTVHVVNHIPLIRPGNELSLYKFINIPQPTNLTDANEQSVFLEFQPQEMYLGIAKDHTSYFIMDETDMSSCQKLYGSNEHFFCPSQSRIKKTYHTCLFALFQGNTDVIKKICPQTLANEISKSSRLDKDHWMIFESTPQDLRIDCPNEKSIRKQIQEAVMVRLDPGCQVNTNSRTITRPYYEAEATMSDYFHQPLPSPDIWVLEDSQPHFNKTVKDFIRKSGQRIPVETIRTVAKFRDQLAKARRAWGFQFHFPTWLFHAFLPSFASLVAIGLSLFLAVKCGPRIFPKCSKTEKDPEKDPVWRTPIIKKSTVAGVRLTSDLAHLNKTNTYSDDPAAGEHVELDEKRASGLYHRIPSVDDLKKDPNRIEPLPEHLIAEVKQLRETQLKQAEHQRSITDELISQHNIIADQIKETAALKEENTELKKRLVKKRPIQPGTVALPPASCHPGSTPTPPVGIASFPPTGGPVGLAVLTPSVASNAAPVVPVTETYPPLNRCS